jgi:hypothetical protein
LAPKAANYPVAVIARHPDPHRRRRQALALATLLAVASSACGGGPNTADVAAADGSDAGSAVGGIVGGVVKGNDDDDPDTTDPDTTDSTDTTLATDTSLPTETTGTTAATTRPTVPPPSNPGTVATSPPATAAPRPNTVDAGALSADQQDIYNYVTGLVGGMELEVGLVNSAQSHSGNMAAGNHTNSSGNLFAETGFPWRSVSEVTAAGPDLASVKSVIDGKTGALSGYGYVGVGISSANGLVYVDIRVGKL